MLDRLKGALQSGLVNRDQMALKHLIEQIKKERKPLAELVDGLRPFLRQVAMSTMARRDVAGMRACRDVFRLVRS